MDLDRFDPLASPSNALDYSSLSPEELDKLIDHVYSAKLSPQCEAAIIGRSFRTLTFYLIWFLFCLQLSSRVIVSFIFVKIRFY